MLQEQITIAIADKGSVSAMITGPEKIDAVNSGVVIAHAAGNDMHSELIVAVAKGLAEAGFATLRFNLPYRERGKKSPDAQ